MWNAIRHVVRELAREMEQDPGPEWEPVIGGSYLFSVMPGWLGVIKISSFDRRHYVGDAAWLDDIRTGANTDIASVATEAEARAIPGYYRPLPGAMLLRRTVNFMVPCKIDVTPLLKG